MSNNKNNNSNSEESGSNENDLNVPVAVELEELNTNSENWIITVRVVTKHDIVTWNKPSGSGKFFNMDLMCVLQHNNLDNDNKKSSSSSSPTMIRAVSFNEACDKFYDLIEEDHVYTITGGKIKKRDSRFNKLPHPCELSLSAEDTVIIECNNKRYYRKSDLPKDLFVTIADLTSLDIGTTINIVAEVHALQPIIAFESAKGPSQRRKIHLVDQSKHEILTTMWGDKCEHPFLYEGSVIVIKNAELNEFADNRDIKTTRSTKILAANLDMPEAIPILKWIHDTPEIERNSASYYTKITRDSFKKAVEQRVTCKDLRDIISSGGFINWIQKSNSPQQQQKQNDPLLQLLISGGDDQTNLSNTQVVFKLSGTIHSIKYEKDRPMTYPACIKCKGKVIQEKNGIGYRCDKCKTNSLDPPRGYVINVILYDDTGSIEVTIFNELALKLLKVSAQEMFKNSLVPVNDNEDEEEQKQNISGSNNGAVRSDGQILSDLIEDQVRYHEFSWTIRENIDKKTGHVQFNGSVALTFDSVAEINKEEKNIFAELNKDL